MDPEVSRLIEDLRVRASQCACAGCQSLRTWAEQIEREAPASLAAVDELPDMAAAIVEECDCEGCRFSRFMLVQGMHAEEADGGG